MKTQTTQTKRPMYQKVLAIATLISTVGGTLTAIMTYQNIGLTENFISQWLSSFAIALLIMAPTGFLLITLIEKLVRFAMPASKKIHQQLITGISMALIMESILAISTTANTIGMSNQSHFLAACQQAFFAALPFGLIMAVLMAVVLKPKLDKFIAS